MGATVAVQCLEISGADTLCPPASVPSEPSLKLLRPKPSFPAGATLGVKAGDSGLPDLERLRQARTQSGADSLEGIGLATELADHLWRKGAAAEAAAEYADAQARCERLVAAQRGPRSELLLAEILLGHALSIQCAQSVSVLANEKVRNLLERAHALACRHELAQVPNKAGRAALLAAVASHSLGWICERQGDWERAKAYTSEAEARLCEARATGQTPRRPGGVVVAPRHAYIRKLEENMMTTAHMEALAPEWWRQSGLAAKSDGGADAALAWRLCGLEPRRSSSTGIEVPGMSNPARCDLWLDAADDAAALGDAEAAMMWRRRALAGGGASVSNNTVAQRVQSQPKTAQLVT